MSDAPSPGRVPPPLTVAASLVGVEGAVLTLLGVAELANVSTERLGLGLSTAAFFTAYGVVLLAAAVGLFRRAGWSRGPTLFTQLVWLGLAWNLREHTLVAVLLAATAVVVLVGLLHRDSIAALSPGPPDEPDPT
ncbi:hypothetical protein [Nocardioides sp. TF02-7]|uniref:hypothetical protein n=1 Tax=Nocardioides sp. TF02-7 TaxID=2917724 RepID=UPI001F06B3E5|nr:hypothetical protein [Nocardioides sp. TF02-7]UMG91948.1 hypothetical protein MF408_18315 [Nocardioides sp. TF02-7]